jgi:hypothetical protein
VDGECSTLAPREADELIPSENSADVASGHPGAHLVVVPNCGRLSVRCNALWTGRATLRGDMVSI